MNTVLRHSMFGMYAISAIAIWFATDHWDKAFTILLFLLCMGFLLIDSSIRREAKK